jgi:sugar phosphate isomerase/epimerase
LVDVKDIVLVHLNDAPAGVDITELVDNQRRLPCATGVVDTAGFMATLRKIGYAGPCEAEPFDNTLKELASDEERALTVGKSMDAAFNA